MTIISAGFQSYLDIAVQYYGTADAAPMLAEANGQDLTDNILAGTILILPIVATADEAVAIKNYFKSKAIVPSNINVPTNYIQGAAVGTLIVA